MIMLAEDNFLLDGIGDTISTIYGNIKVLPSETSKMYQLDDGSITYGSKEYYFITTIAYGELVNLDDVLTWATSGKTYKFVVTNVIPDTTGWVKILCYLRSI